jgi:hypothetical protein
LQFPQRYALQRAFISSELFEAFSAERIIHPNGHLGLKPWGVKEFSILDTDGNLVTFEEDPV